MRKYSKTTNGRNTRLKVFTIVSEQKALRWEASHKSRGWTPYNGPLTSGIYARVNNTWYDVRELDATTLALT